MGGTVSGGSAGSRRDAVYDHIHWSQTGEHVSVGGDAPYLQSLRKGEGFREGEGGGAGVTRGGDGRRQKSSSGKPWRIFCGRPG